MHKQGTKWVTSDSQFRHWDDLGISKDRQKDTYIAIANEPYRSDVRHVVFTLPGQEKMDSDGRSDLTGQPEKDKWKTKFDEEKTRVSAIDESHGGVKSLPYKIMMLETESGHPLRSLDDTFVAMAYDHRYNYDVTGPGAKEDRIRNAFLRWLKSKFYESKIETILI